MSCLWWWIDLKHLQNKWSHISTPLSSKKKREIIKALVKRVEIFKNEVIIVFRVAPVPEAIQGEVAGVATNEGNQFMQDCTRRTDARAGSQA